MNIEEIFENLCSEAKNERMRKTLRAIHDVCSEQHERGSKDLSVATIARLGEGKGVPQAQSIRNKSGEIYRALINSWQDAYPKPLKPKISTSLEWVERIEDPAIKYLIYDLVSEKKSLASELQLCKSATKLNIDMRQLESYELQKLPTLIDSEREAVVQAIDDSFLARKGLKRTSRGAIVDSSDKVIFKNGFVSAIEKLISI